MQLPCLFHPALLSSSSCVLSCLSTILPVPISSLLSLCIIKWFMQLRAERERERGRCSTASALLCEQVKERERKQNACCTASEVSEKGEGEMVNYSVKEKRLRLMWFLFASEEGGNKRPSANESAGGFNNFLPATGLASSL